MTLTAYRVDLTLLKDNGPVNLLPDEICEGADFGGFAGMAD